MNNTARDLYLLSALALQAGKQDQAVKLMQASLSSASSVTFFLDEISSSTSAVTPEVAPMGFHALLTHLESTSSNPDTAQDEKDSDDPAPNYTPVLYADFIDDELESEYDDGTHELDEFGGELETLDGPPYNTGEIDDEDPVTTDIIQSLSNSPSHIKKVFV